MGSSKPQEKEIVGLHFQEIPLDEAVNAVIAGDGYYSHIKEKLLEALPRLSPGKAFAFGLPNGKEVAEDQRRGICKALNGTLNKAKIDWYVTYSGTKKLFVCVPKTVPRADQKKDANNGNVPQSAHTDADVFRLRDKGLTANEIAKELPDIPLRHVKYLCYQVAPGRKKSSPPPTTPQAIHIDDFVARARDALNFHGAFLPGRMHKDCKRFRAAASLVGTKDLGFTGVALDKALGFKNGGANYYANNPDQADKADLQKLRLALIHGGQ